MPDAQPTQHGEAKRIDYTFGIAMLVIAIALTVFFGFMLSLDVAGYRADQQRLFNQCLEDHKEYECVRIMGR